MRPKSARVKKTLINIAYTIRTIQNNQYTNQITTMFVLGNTLDSNIEVIYH
jgi:hypothetical protein